MANSAEVSCNPFDQLPDEIVLDILSRLGPSAVAVSKASATCNRWRRLCRWVPGLKFYPLHNDSGELVAPMTEELVSRLLLKTSGLQHLNLTSGPPPCLCARNHPREFIFEAWMRHSGKSLLSLSVSCAALARKASSHNEHSHMTVNARDSEDLSAHLRHVSHYCRNLEALAVSYLTLPSPSFLRMRPMMRLEELALSWLHTSSPCVQAILNSTPNLRRLSIFMAGGCTELNLKLPGTLEHVDFAYARLDSCHLSNATSLKSLTFRDMFLREVVVTGATALAEVSVATASLLAVSLPDTANLERLELKAACLDWDAVHSLVLQNGRSLASLSFDFFSSTGETSAEGQAARMFSLPWLAAVCPNLKSLQLGSLPWELLTSSVVSDGLLLQDTTAPMAYWPGLERLQVQLDAERAESLLLLHAFLSNVKTLTSVEIKLTSETGEGEGDGEDVERAEREREEEEEGDEYQPETRMEEGQVEIEREEETGVLARAKSAGNDNGMERRRWRRQIFLRGVLALKQRFPTASVSMSLAY